MRGEGSFSADISFGLPARIEHEDSIGEWSLDKVAMALCHPLMKEGVSSENKGLVGKVVACWEECDAQVLAPKFPAVEPEPEEGPKMKPPTVVGLEGMKPSPEQIELIVPLMLRNT